MVFTSRKCVASLIFSLSLVWLLKCKSFKNSKNVISFIVFGIFKEIFSDVAYCCKSFFFLKKIIPMDVIFLSFSWEIMDN
jgi:hypothetical protein